MTVLAPIHLDLTTPRGEHHLSYAFDRSRGVQAGMYESLEADRFYEPETTMLIAAVLRPGDVFVDVGAHVGYFSMIAASIVGPTGQVVSFEPAPDNYAHLVEHIRLNQYQHVLPLHCAAGSTEGVFDLHLNADNDGGHALWDVRMHQDNAKSRATPRRYPVYVATLDRVLETVASGRVRVIKMDVEGNEHAVLQGARRTLERHQVPFVIAEINRGGLMALGTSEESLRAYMASLGYDTWLIRPDTMELTKLEPGVTVTANVVFNVLFRRGDAPIG